MRVEGWLARAARARPRALALDGPDGQLSYSQLQARARVCARGLAARNVRQGDRVAIALEPGLAFAETLHACMDLGAVAVPIDLRLGERERARLCETAALVVSDPLAADGAPGAAREPAHEGDPTGEGDLGAAHDLDAVAAVIHTSGTTGAPRPIELTYGNFLWSALGSAVALGLDPDERWLCALPVAHVGGLSILVRSAIYATTAVVHPRFYTDTVLGELRGGNITVVSLVATTLARLLDAGLERPGALRCALTGGGPMPDELLARARGAGVPVTTTYGLTEACSQVTAGGPPLFCTRVRLGEGGEIMVSGPTVAPGSCDGDGWLHTGDLGAWDERGLLRVTGRASETIISGGENVAPAEVEAALEAHPDVLEAAVVGRPDPRWGEAVVAIVVPRDASRPSESDLRAHCAARLASYKVPKRVALIPGPLPRTPSGKLLRREIA